MREDGKRESVMERIKLHNTTIHIYLILSMLYIEKRGKVTHYYTKVLKYILNVNTYTHKYKSIVNLWFLYRIRNI